MFRRTTAVLLVTAMLGLSQVGCIGRGALGGKVMKFNLSVTENKWGRWVVFLVLNVIPVYSIAGLIDLIIINSIEFHSGTNPISDQPRLAVREGHEEIVATDGTRAASTMNEDGSVTIEITDTEGAKQRVRLVPVPGGIEARDAEGNYLGRVDGEGRLHTSTGAVELAPGT